MADDSQNDATSMSDYSVALLAAAGGLLFLAMGDVRMMGASLVLSIGAALVVESRTRGPIWQYAGYALVGLAAALLVIDTVLDVMG
jgi:hypothetical protein